MVAGAVLDEVQGKVAPVRDDSNLEGGGRPATGTPGTGALMGRG